jgi:hypothetical protein
MFFLSGFAQRKHINHHNYNNLDFLIHWNSNDVDVFFGNNSYREMYFDFKPKKGTWRLKKDIRKKHFGFGFGCGPKTKVLARFENPNGGKDFVIRINRKGYWKYNGPNKWYNIFRKKMLNNL